MEINLTRTGGNYIRAILFHRTCIILMLPIIFTLVVLAIINPFWFRDSMMDWVERFSSNLGTKLRYKMYGIYLGCDPKVWHTLKGDLK